MELQVISAIAGSREAYNLLEDILDPSDFSDTSQIIVSEIRKYYNKDLEATSVDLSIIRSNIQIEYKDLAKGIVVTLDNLMDASTANVVEAYVNQRIHKLSLKLGTRLSQGVEDGIDELLLKLTELREFRSEALTTDDSKVEDINCKSIKEVFEVYKEENLVHLSPNTLNESIGGGIPRPSHVVVFATPNAGKTLTAVSLASGFLRKGYKVLYICNEDSDDSILSRVVCNLSSMSKDQVFENLDRADRLAHKRGYGNFTISSPEGGDLGFIERRVKKNTPDILIVDQLRNLDMGKQSKVEGLDYVTRTLRIIGRKYNLITISITQAGDRATNKLVLDMNDADSSRIGISAGCEYMIGIGMNDEYEQAHRRMISICKSKNPDVDRNFPVRVNLPLSRLEDVTLQRTT